MIDSLPGRFYPAGAGHSNKLYRLNWQFLTLHQEYRLHSVKVQTSLTFTLTGTIFPHIPILGIWGIMGKFILTFH